MKAKKLDLSPYATDQRDGNDKPIMYVVRNSLISLLFHPELHLTAVQLLETNELADKIRTSGDTILLSQDEYLRVEHAANVATGYGQNDVEFVQRILNAPEVTVEEPAKPPAV